MPKQVDHEERRREIAAAVVRLAGERGLQGVTFREVAAGVAGRGAPVVYNAANEVAVAAFLRGQIAFTDISSLVARTLNRQMPPAPQCLDDVLAVDAEARARAAHMLEPA